MTGTTGHENGIMIRCSGFFVSLKTLKKMLDEFRYNIRRGKNFTL